MEFVRSYNCMSFHLPQKQLHCQWKRAFSAKSYYKGRDEEVLGVYCYYYFCFCQCHNHHHQRHIHLPCSLVRYWLSSAILGVGCCLGRRRLHLLHSFARLVDLAGNASWNQLFTAAIQALARRHQKNFPHRWFEAGLLRTYLPTTQVQPLVGWEGNNTWEGEDDRKEKEIYYLFQAKI